MSNATRVRKKKKYKCPNPLFEQWLTEWKDEASSKGLKTQYIYSKALKSLKKYPLPLSTGKEAKILEFFGDKICNMLDEKLQQHQIQSDQSSSNSNSQVLPKSPSRNKNSGAQTNTTRAKPVSQSSVAPIACILPDIPDHGSVQSSSWSSSQESFDKFTLSPGTFDVILCVDNCETLAGHGKSKKHFIDELKRSKVDFEIRKLHVGDFLWVARPKGSTDPSEELVLDFVVERKRLDDLWKSIKDGRFREQKFRLRHCGAVHPVYLIEHYSLIGMPESTLEQAIVNTQIVDGFMIKRTQNVKESAAYFAMMTKYLQKNLQIETLTSGPRQSKPISFGSNRTYITFKDFNSGAVKNKCLNVKEMFAKHLLQFFGLSVERAVAIVEQFETPSKLMMSLQRCSTENERIKLLANLRFGKFKKSIGQALARQIQQYYTTEQAFR